MILTLVSFEFNFAFQLAVCLNCLQTLEICKIFLIEHIQHERWEKTPGWMDGIDPKLFKVQIIGCECSHFIVSKKYQVHKSGICFAVPTNIYQNLMGPPLSRDLGEE